MPAAPPAAADQQYMRRALELARRGWGRVAPNPLVGAVVVRDGEVVGEGWHAEYGGPHAEVAALRRAGDRARGATLYVTLEPCSHHGKTPPCTDAVVAAGVHRLVFATSDPNPRAAGGGARLRDAGVEVLGGVEREAGGDLNAPFLHAFSPEGQRRPWIELKLALSLDARMADHTGRSAWITGEAARAEVHELRAGHDGIAVGIGTALADDPLLTARGSTRPRRPPVRVVFDGQLRLPAVSRLVRSVDEAPLWLVCQPSAPSARREALVGLGVKLLAVRTLAEALAALRAEGIGSLFCEGGARLASSLLEDDVVDRLSLFYAPLLLGPRGSSPFEIRPERSIEEVHRWRQLRTERFGPDTMISLAKE